MTTLEERVRRVGQELHRASATYVERAPGSAYVSTAPAPVRRSRVVVVVAAALVVCVVALLVVQRTQEESSTVTEPPEGLAISATVGGDSWIWPSADSGVAATSAEEVARAFADRVLRLPDAVIIDTTGGGLQPTFLRIETPSLQLQVLVAPQGAPDRWVIHQLNVTGPSLFAQALHVPSRVDASSAELFVRYVSGMRAFVVPVEPVGGVIELPVHDVVAAVIAVFRNSNGDVIDVQGAHWNSVTNTSVVACDFSLNGSNVLAPQFGAVAGATSSAKIGPYAVTLTIIAAPDDGLTLRVDAAGPLADGRAQDPAWPEGVVWRDEYPIGPDRGQTITGSTQLQGTLAYRCTKQGVASSTGVASDARPKFIPGARPASRPGVGGSR